MINIVYQNVRNRKTAEICKPKPLIHNMDILQNQIRIQKKYTYLTKTIHIKVT